MEITIFEWHTKTQ